MFWHIEQPGIDPFSSEYWWHRLLVYVALVGITEYIDFQLAVSGKVWVVCVIT